MFSNRSTSRRLARIFFFALLLNGSHNTLAQDNDNDPPPVVPKKSKFLTGFYVGSYFANKYSASNYSGYGFDQAGHRNTFLNSWMYQKLYNEYGGGYGQTDLVAQALGVDPHQWAFNESDMPMNMHYVPAILVGLNFKIPVDKKSALLFNVNGTKLSVEGNFTISTFKPQTINNPATNPNLNIFTIRGKEQRLQFQLGFQRIFGDDDKLNFFGDIGLIGTLSKFDQNMVYINTLQIDLTTYFNQTLYAAPGPGRRPVGFGVGAYAGAGFNVNINPKFTLQLLYTLTHEKVNFGTNPALKLQQSVGFRVYYNI